jgi:hypothetical protein
MRIWTVGATLGATALALAALAGCGGGGSDGQNAVHAATAVQILDAFDQESALAATFVDDVDVGGTPEEAASFAAARALDAWTPSGCVVVTLDPIDAAHVTFELSECNGPFSLTGVNGLFSVRYGRGTDGNLSLAVTTGPLVRIGEWARQSLRIDGSYVQSGAERRLSAHGTGAAENAAGLMFDGGGDYRSGWDEGAACRSLDGTWDSQTGASHFSSEATGLVRCAGGCPQGGGRLVFKDAPPGTRQVTLAFDGGPTASWVADDGETGTIALPCGN